MIVFSSVEAATAEGFVVVEFDKEYQLFICEKDIERNSRRARMRAFARPAEVRPAA
jgi:hypothetical protein